MQKVIVVTETKSYLVHSFVKQLEDNGIIVEVLGSVMAAEYTFTSDVECLFLYADDGLLANARYLINAKDEAIKNGIPVFVAGNYNDIASIEQIIPKHYIKRSFVHPFDVKEVARNLFDYIENYGKQVRKTILIVDDSGPVLRSLKASLERKYQIIPANSGAMAIKYISLNKPDLILLDYNMPVVDGRQVLEMIRTESDFCDIPVIFLTSRGDRESIMSVVDLKPEGYLLKTLPLPKIIEAVDKFFDKQSQK